MKQLCALCMFLVLQFFEVSGQILKFGHQIDKAGNLLLVDTAFRMNNIPHLVHSKMFYKSPLPLDTFLVVVKSLEGKVSKFYMKRSAYKLDAYAVLKFREDGIYKVFVVNPKTKATVAAKRIYITSAVNPTVAALKNHFYNDLAMKGKATPNTPSKSNPNVVKSTNTVKPNVGTNSVSKVGNNKVEVKKPASEEEKLPEFDENLDIDDVDYDDDVPAVDDDDDNNVDDFDDND